MFAGILELGDLALKGIVQHFQGKQQLDAAVTQNKIRLASNEQTYNHDWEMAQLKDSDWFTRRCTFILVVTPVVANVISPTWGTHIFTAMATLPKWYSDTFTTILLATYGLHSIKNPLSSIIGAVKSKPSGNKS